MEMIYLPGMDWEEVFKSLGVVVGAAASLYQIRSLIPPSRARLKADLEILKSLDPSDAAAPLLKAHIDRTLWVLYSPAAARSASSRFHVYSWKDFILGLVFMPSFLIWTVYLVHRGSWWPAILTGFAAFASFGGILVGLDAKRVNVEQQPNPPASPVSETVPTTDPTM